MNTTTRPSYNRNTHPLFSFYDLYFVIIFISLANIIRKMNKYDDSFKNIEILYGNIKHQINIIHNKYISLETNYDVLKDCFRELKCDFRVTERITNELVSKVDNLKYNVDTIRDDLDIYEEQLLAIKQHNQEQDEKLQEVENHHYDFKDYDDKLDRYNNNLTVMYRNFQDDIRRISEKLESK